MFGFGKSKWGAPRPTILSAAPRPDVVSSEATFGTNGRLESLDAVPKETTQGIVAACRLQRRLFRKDPVRLAAIDQAAVALKDVLKLSTAGGDVSEYERFKRLRDRALN